jgi:DNA topoisomerase-1
MNIFIVESSTKIKPIKRYLGEDWTVIATNGHICHFEDFDFNTISSLTSITDVLPFFKPLSNNTFFRNFQKILNNPHGKIYIGTDCDREGEFIAFSIIHFFHLSDFNRCIFNEISESAILHSIANPVNINYPVVYSCVSRSMIDYSIGFLISPFLNKFIGGGGGGGGAGGGGKSSKCVLSAGRCQTIALRLIYDRFLIKPPDEYDYSVTGHFLEKYHLPFQFHLNTSFSKESLADFFEKSKHHRHFITMSEKKDVFKSAPPPLNTANLLQSSSNILSYSPKKTMLIAQKLYQMGKITYIRTQSTKYSVDFIQSALQFIQTTYGKDSIITEKELIHIKNDSINSNIPHEAIRPTDIFDIPTMDSEPLYKLIWDNTVRSCMCCAFYHKYDLTIDSPIKDGFYKHSLEIPVLLGWLKHANIEKISNTDKKGIKTINNNNILLYLLSLNKTNPVVCNSIDANVIVKTPRRYYTESSLIQQLEQLNIGRPSTYAHFAEIIKERGYVKIMDISGVSLECENFTLSFMNSGDTPILQSRIETTIFGNEKSKIVIQPIGIVCIDFLIQHFHELFRYDYTVDMETQLDLLANHTGGLLWTTVVKEFYNNILQFTMSIQKISKFKVSIDSFNEIIFFQNIPYIKRKVYGKDKTNKKYEYYPLKPLFELNMDRLKGGLYTLEDLMEYPNTVIGKYKDTPLKIKTGQFGHYLEWGGNDETGEIKEKEHKFTLSLNSLDTVLFPIYHLNQQQAVDFIESKINDLIDISQSKRILRVIDPFTSIRQGKYGTYLYHKTDNMKKPSFISLKKKSFDFFNASIEDIYSFLDKYYNS